MESGQCLVMSEPTSLTRCYFSESTLLNFCGSLKFYPEKLIFTFTVELLFFMVSFDLFYLFFFRKLVGQYKELLWTVGVRWLRRIMVVATSTYIIDTPWKLTLKGLMGRMFTWQGLYLLRSGIYVSTPRECLLPEGCVLIWTWPRVSRGLLMSKWAVSWFSPLTDLPTSPRAARPWMLCVHLLRCWMDKGWVLAWGEQDDFSFQHPWFN